MRLTPVCLFFLLCICKNCIAQDTTAILNRSMLDPNTDIISLSGLKGWVFRNGNDTSWKRMIIETTGWREIDMKNISAKDADKNGKFEGWLRFKFKLDSSFGNIPVGIETLRWAATDIYLDGNFITSFGNTGINGKPYQENRNTLTGLHQFIIETGKEHVLAIYIVDYIDPFDKKFLKTESLINNYSVLVSLTGPLAHTKFTGLVRDSAAYGFLYCGIIGIIGMMFWFLCFQNRIEKNLLLIAISTTLFFFWEFFVNVASYPLEIDFNRWWILFYIGFQSWPLATASMIYTVGVIFNVKYKKILLLFGVVFVAVSFLSTYLYKDSDFGYFAFHPLSAMIVQVYILISSWKKLKGAQWAIVIGVISTTVFSLLWAFLYTFYQNLSFQISILIQSLQCLSYPVSLMIYVVIRFKEILKEVQLNADKVVKMTEEKQEMLAQQNELLEEQVEERTRELKASQAQLIQSEKLASLGQLTAGIAHEIQNPLNFVNNFSEINRELINDLVEEVDKGSLEEVKLLVKDIQENEEKINHHGQRAAAIVKGMLQHSRTSSGVKEPTDMNALCDEYLRLSYHGLRAKDKSFNAKFETHFDDNIGKINAVPQDMGRVILNLINNAFYAVTEQRKLGIEDYEPMVTVSTKKEHDKIFISIADNGTGIPQNVVDKIFQPFFTTKPTGEGTGLGLSLSYDIIKTHGGQISVDSKEGTGTIFIIQLPSS